MFPIYTQPSKAASVTVHIDSGVPIAVPKSIAFGVGNKKERYKTWLSESSKDRPDVTAFLVRLYGLAAEKGGMVLLSRSKAYPYQAAALREYFVENEELLKTILPYYQPPADSGKQPGDAQAAGAMPDMGGMKPMSMSDFPQDQQEMFMRMIQEEQAKQANGTSTVPTVAIPHGESLHPRLDPAAPEHDVSPIIPRLE